MFNPNKLYSDFGFFGLSHCLLTRLQLGLREYLRGFANASLVKNLVNTISNTKIFTIQYSYIRSYSFK